MFVDVSHSSDGVFSLILGAVLTLSHTGGIFPSTAQGGVNLTRTYLTAAEGTIRHILGNIIEGTFKGGHQ